MEGWGGGTVNTRPSPLRFKCLNDRGALLSRDRRYRYLLWRFWGVSTLLRLVAFIGLNPSTADENEDDPTIRRCIGFAKAWGYEGILMVNLWGFRATEPKDLMLEAAFGKDIRGPANYDWVRWACRRAELVVASWGADGSWDEGAEYCVKKIRPILNDRQTPLFCLGETKAGQPRHPLYLKKTTKPVVWSGF